MADLLRECNTGDLKLDHKTFQETWCVRCHRPECALAVLAKTDPMAHRNATWRERFFGTPEADLSVPKFAQIAQIDFPNLLQKAMKLEISERRGDWSVPEIPVLDGKIIVAPSSTTNHVDEAVQKLSRRGGSFLLDEPEPEPEPEPDEEELGPEEEELELEPEVPKPVTPRPLPVKAPGPMPTGRNTPDPGEVMIGGGPASASPQGTFRGRPSGETDPWAPPAKPTVTVVKAGAKIQFGADGKAKVVDG